MCRSRVINDYVFFGDIDLTLDLFQWYLLNMQVLYPATAISSFVTLGPRIWAMHKTRIMTRIAPITTVTELTIALSEEWVELDQIVIRNTVT